MIKRANVNYCKNLFRKYAEENSSSADYQPHKSKGNMFSRGISGIGRGFTHWPDYWESAWNKIAPDYKYSQFEIDQLPEDEAMSIIETQNGANNGRFRNSLRNSLRAIGRFPRKSYERLGNWFRNKMPGAKKERAKNAYLDAKVTNAKYKADRIARDSKNFQDEYIYNNMDLVAPLMHTLDAIRRRRSQENEYFDYYD